MIIKKLQPSVVDKNLSDLLSEFGPHKLKIVRKNHIFALVSFQDKQKAKEAVKNLKSETFMGHPIFIEHFRKIDHNQIDPK